MKEETNKNRYVCIIKSDSSPDVKACFISKMLEQIKKDGLSPIGEIKEHHLLRDGIVRLSMYAK